MLLLFSIPVGLLIGYTCRGRLSRLVELRFRWMGLIPIALIVQLAIFPSFFRTPLFPYATTSLHFLSYGLICLWLLVNLRVLPMAVIGLGALCNLVAIAVNGGRMPASATALTAAGATVAAEELIDRVFFANVVLMSDTTRLNWLGDVLHVPSWMPFATAFSIGDAILFVGLVWLIARGMKGRGKEPR